MSQIKEQELKKQIREKEWSPLYFIYGEEAYLKGHYVKQMLGKLVDKTFESFNFHSFEGRETSVAEIAAAVEMLPMMAEYSVVLVHDMPLDALSAGEMENLKELLKEPQESCVLIFWMDGIEVNVKKNAKWRSVISLMDKAGTVAQMEKRSTSALTKLLMDGAKKRDCVFGQAEANYLISIAGDDMQTLLLELDKVCHYVGGGQITKADVDAVAIKSLDAKAFDLAKALVRGDYGAAYVLLHHLMDQKEEPIAVLAAISTSYVDMYRAKVAKIAGVQAVEVAKSFNYRNKEFRLRNASRDCAKLSIHQIRNCIDELCRADCLMKSSRMDKQLVLEETMMKLFLAVKEG